MSTSYIKLCKIVDHIKPQTKVPVHIEKTANFDFFEALTSEYDILDKILSYLNFKDLTNVAKLNETWAINVEMILKKRLSPVLFSLSAPICYMFPDPIDINPALCIVFHELTEFNNGGQIKLNTYICVHGGDQDTRKPVLEFLENDLLCSKCPMASLTCRQISSSFTSSRNFNGLILPSIPDIKMSVFRVSNARAKIPEILEQNIGKDNELICLLTYGLYVRKTNINALISAIRNRQSSNFAFGGGYVMGMQAFNYLGNKTGTICLKTDLLCISFSKPKNKDVAFNAYSIIIKDHATTEKEIEDYLLKLKANYVQRKYGIIFRITCISRQDELPSEIHLLNKLFPNLEVLGFNGDGEIGWDHYQDTDGQSEAKKKKQEQSKQLLHELTTIIVLLTWGKKS